MFDFIIKYLFGRDIFISYARADSYGYALQLARAFMERSYSVRADFLGSDAGKTTPPNLLRDCRRSKILVVLASKSSVDSENVADEVRQFSNRGRWIVPVDLDGSYTNAPWYDLVAGPPVSFERKLHERSTSNQSDEADHENAQLVPTQAVVDRIVDTYDFVRQEQRLLVATIGATVILVVFLVAAILARIDARSARNDAGISANLASDA